MVNQILIKIPLTVPQRHPRRRRLLLVPHGVDVIRAKPSDIALESITAKLYQTVARQTSRRVWARNLVKHKHGGYSQKRKRVMTKAAVAANKRVAADRRLASARLLSAKKRSSVTGGGMSSVTLDDVELLLGLH